MVEARHFLALGVSALCGFSATPLLYSGLLCSYFPQCLLVHSLFQLPLFEAEYEYQEDLIGHFVDVRK